MTDKKIIDFMGLRYIAAGISLVLLLGSIISLAVNQLNFGLDFTGGTLLEVEYSDALALKEIRDTLKAAGYERAVVVNFGTDTDVLVRLPQSKSAKLGDELIASLRANYSGTVELRRVEYVGPQVGEELREQGGLAMLMALGLVMLFPIF